MYNENDNCVYHDKNTDRISIEMLPNSSENIYLTCFSLEYRESLLQNYAFVVRYGFLFCESVYIICFFSYYLVSQLPWDCHFIKVITIGGSRGGREGRTPPPLGVQILSISCSFRENLACSRPPWRVHAPPSGKSWIRH